MRTPPRPASFRSPPLASSGKRAPAWTLAMCRFSARGVQVLEVLSQRLLDIPSTAETREIEAREILACVEPAPFEPPCGQVFVRSIDGIKVYEMDIELENVGSHRLHSACPAQAVLAVIFVATAWHLIASPPSVEAAAQMAPARLIPDAWTVGLL